MLERMELPWQNCCSSLPSLASGHYGQDFPLGHHQQLPVVWFLVHLVSNVFVYIKHNSAHMLPSVTRPFSMILCMGLGTRLSFPLFLGSLLREATKIIAGMDYTMQSMWFHLLGEGSDSMNAYNTDLTVLLNDVWMYAAHSPSTYTCAIEVWALHVVPQGCRWTVVWSSPTSQAFLSQSPHSSCRGRTHLESEREDKTVLASIMMGWEIH